MRLAKDVRMERFRDAVFIAVLLSIAACCGCSSSATTPDALESATTTMTVYEAGSGLFLPTVLKEVRPAYTSEAIQNRIQGTVLLAADVLPDGTVGKVVVLRSLDTTFGLDAQAVLATKQWVFSPAMKDGVAVAIRVTVEMTFTLR